MPPFSADFADVLHFSRCRSLNFSDIASHECDIVIITDELFVLNVEIRDPVRETWALVAMTFGLVMAIGIPSG